MMFIKVIRKIPNSCYHIFSFIYRVTKHFLKSHGIVAANSLTFSLVLGFIPFVIALAVIGYLLPFSSKVVDGIEYFYFNRFIPQTGQEIYYLFKVSFEHSGKLSIFGGLSLIISCYGLMFTIEQHLNMMSISRRSRAWYKSLLIFTILVWCNILITYSLGYFTMWLDNMIDSELISHYVSMCLAHVVTIFSFMFLYKFLPYKKVHLKNAVVCGLLATIVFATIQGYFIFSMNRMKDDYSLLYGSLAILPIFLLWVYSEVLILLYFASMLFALEEKPHWRRKKKFKTRTQQ